MSVRGALRAVDAVDEIENVDQLFEPRRARKKKLYRARVDVFEEYSAEEFRKKYRFTKEGAIVLVNSFEDSLTPESDRGGSLSPEFQILTALRCWGRNEIQDDCADLHGVSQQSISNICRKVAVSIARARPKYIYMPRSVEGEAEAAHKFNSICGFRNVIGCIDCTHIRIPNVRTDVGQYYINRKGFPSLNVQAVCDASLKFTDIVARWHGSAHDSRIFNESRLKQRFEAGEFQGRLLGDSGYGCLPYLFTPVLTPRTVKEAAYNCKHKKTRNSVERCFGVWKSRFRCLQTGFRTSLEVTKTCIVALAVLHNIAVDLNEPAFPIEEEANEPLLPAPPPNARGAAVRAAFIEANF